jgi:streptogramin lyase
MSEFERLLKTSLQDAGSEFEPDDLLASRHKFIEARRRRRVVGFVSGLALAGAATVAVLFVATSTVAPLEDGPDIAPASGPGLAQTIPVGVEPTGVTVDSSGTVWVANSGDNSVSRLSPNAETAQSIPLPSAPDDVAATDNFVYVTDSVRDAPRGATGSANVIDRQTGSLAKRDNPDDIPDGSRAQLFGGVLTEGSRSDLGHIDVASSGDSLWASSASQEGVALNLDDGGVQFFPEVPASGEITTLDGIGFALDAGTKELFRMAPGTSPETEALQLPADVAIDDGGNLDMVGGLGSIWIAQDDVLYRIDPDSGQLTGRIDLGEGDYAAVATGEGYVWVLESSSDEGADSRLYKVDPDSVQVVGVPLVLEGRLADVAAGGGSVWITSRSSDSLLRISPRGL